MGTSIRSKGSINQSDDSARPGRAVSGAVTSALGAYNGSFDNTVARGLDDSKPYALGNGVKKAPESAYSEGDAYSDPHPTDNVGRPQFG